MGEDTASELTDEQKEKGFKSMSRNGDGSITYVITKNAHKTMMEDLRTSTAKTLDDIVTSGSFTSIKKIEYITISPRFLCGLIKKRLKVVWMVFLR